MTTKNTTGSNKKLNFNIKKIPELKLNVHNANQHSSQHHQMAYPQITTDDQRLVKYKANDENMAQTNLEFTSARVMPSQNSQIGGYPKDNSNKFIRMDKDLTRNTLIHGGPGQQLNIQNLKAKSFQV